MYNHNIEENVMDIYYICIQIILEIEKDLDNIKEEKETNRFQLLLLQLENKISEYLK